MKAINTLFHEQPMTPERLAEIVVEAMRETQKLAVKIHNQSRPGEFRDSLDCEMAYRIGYARSLTKPIAP